MTWDFPEVNPFAGAAGDLQQTFDSMTRVLDRLPAEGVGVVKQLDATASMEGVANPTVATDPPYYDNIGYADLSNYLKRVNRC